jgi:hypothetical protein
VSPPFAARPGPHPSRDDEKGKVLRTAGLTRSQAFRLPGPQSTVVLHPRITGTESYIT